MNGRSPNGDRAKDCERKIKDRDSARHFWIKPNCWAVPKHVTNPIHKVEEDSDCPQEQYDLPRNREDYTFDDSIRLFAGREGNEPCGDKECTEIQGGARYAVEDRCVHRRVESPHLQVWRQGPGIIPGLS